MTYKRQVQNRETLSVSASDELKDTVEFVRLLKTFNEERQKALLLIMQGTAVLSGRKENIFE